MKKLAAAVAASILASCATPPPNTPGAGAGETYTPFIDMQGLDMDRYSADLSSCRAYAKQIDPYKQEMEAMLGGMIVGAMLGAAFGGGTRMAEAGGVAGGSANMNAAGSKARNKQETIIANCMAGRGYRVLDGATIPASTSVPSPYAPTTPGMGNAAPAHHSTPSFPGCGWVGYEWKCQGR